MSDLASESASTARGESASGEPASGEFLWYIPTSDTPYRVEAARVGTRLLPRLRPPVTV